jgi:methylenetetrahydrofolate dehydrogenase (NADP+)/methenyltetrahydrofolate cyclohydrolase
MKKYMYTRLIFSFLFIAFFTTSCYTQLAVVKPHRVYVYERTVEPDEQEESADTVYYEDEEEPASEVYVRTKLRRARKNGIDATLYELGPDATQTEVMDLVERLNNDPATHGFIVQLPLPDQISADDVLAAVAPHKDVDGFHPYNVGMLVTGGEGFVPATALGVLSLIDSTGVDPRGLNAVVVGRSNIVGKPVAMLLLHRHATVTICHSRTRDLAAEVARAEILVVSVGRAGTIPGDWVRPGAVVIDVGINRLEDGSLTGDVDFEGASLRAGHITPVPGGVGPMTVAHLMENTVLAAARQSGLKPDGW